MGPWESFVEQTMNRCVHYNGLAALPGLTKREACLAGVRYDSVEDPGARPLNIPCVNAQCRTCDKAKYPTREEAEEQERQLHERIAEFSRKLDSNVCPHCNSQVEHQRQAGSCVYAEPCGCRLYQGKARPAPPTGKEKG